MFQRKEKSLSLTGIQTMDHPACSLVAEGIVSPWSITNIFLNGCISHIEKYTFKHAIQLHFIPSTLPIIVHSGGQFWRGN